MRTGDFGVSDFRKPRSTRSDKVFLAVRSEVFKTKLASPRGKLP